MSDEHVVVLGGDRVTLALAAAIPLVVLVSKVAGLYDRDEHLLHKTTLDEAPAIFQLATLYTFLIWLGGDALVEEGTALAETGDLGRGQVLGLWGLLFVSLLAARTAAREVARSLTSTERCLVLGGAEAAKGVESKFRGARRVDAAVVGRVPLEPGEINGAGPVVLGGLDELEGLLARHEVDRVIVAPTTADSEQLLYGIRRAKSLGVKVSVLPRLFEVVGSSGRPSRLPPTCEAGLSEPAPGDHVLSVMYGLIFFIVPALMFLAWWRAKPVAVVVVRLKASAPQTDCR